MEKETIDYAITKLNEAFAKVAPKAQELGSEFVEYTVMKTNISAAIDFILLLTTGSFLVYTIKRWGKIWDYVYKKNLEPPLVAGVVVMVFWVIFTSVSFCFDTYNAILANLYPLMWTIERLAK